MIDKEIVIKERTGLRRDREFVRVGVPFAMGELPGTELLALLTPELGEQPVQALSLNRWRDGSVKWALVDFTASLPAAGESVYRLVEKRLEPPDVDQALRVIPGTDSWQVRTGVASFTVDAKQFRPFIRVAGAGGELLSQEGACLFVTELGGRLVPQVDAICLDSEGPLRAVLSLRGHFGAGDAPARFASRLHFFAGTSQVMVEFTIQNPRPARHPGGLWDLGDPGSLLFRELAFEICFPEGRVTEVALAPEPGREPISQNGLQSLAVYQESSGGENWLSPSHRNREGVVPFRLRGYEILSDETQIATGARATPIFWCGSAARGFSAALPRFWQEFPKALAADRRGVKLSLFPGRCPELYELQGGEQKTHLFHLDFDGNPGSLEWARSPLVAAVSARVMADSGVLADLPAPAAPGERASHLIDRFGCGPGALLGKREAIDEYGWRNFGELYADHEAVYHRGAEPFVSHYNNQYDPCAGMYRMFLMTADPFWGELASDLARHVLDIDIYHTDEDREEYNRGLFWHTDHYVAAGLATHRSFSREQVGDRDPRLCGGGPAAEHCYTTGLMLHYFLTGSPQARDAVLELARWCYRSLCGPSTLLAALKNASRYLSLARHADRAHPRAFPRFPLTRGTGNAISACLDAYEVSGDRSFLDKVEEMVRGALHPADDLEARGLRNPEVAWSYSVLLVSVAKYLGKLEELAEFGECYAHARGCLLAYAEWMCLHEYPYLEKPELLEYPNETWPAQELRKAVVFYHAARYAEAGRREAFLSRGRYFFGAAQEELSRHRTCGLTRPLVLMLQNGWVGPRLEEGGGAAQNAQLPARYRGRSTPNLSLTAVLVRSGAELARALCCFRLRREIVWFRARIG